MTSAERFMLVSLVKQLREYGEQNNRFSEPGLRAYDDAAHHLESMLSVLTEYRIESLEASDSYGKATGEYFWLEC